jgi:hypothetical protein
LLRARQVAIKVVGDAGDDEEQRCEEIARLGSDKEHPYNKWNK